MVVNALAVILPLLAVALIGGLIAWSWIHGGGR
jgi:hypothetical protein